MIIALALLADVGEIKDAYPVVTPSLVVGVALVWRTGD